MASAAPADLDVLMRRAGLFPKPDQLAQMRVAWELLSPILDLIRKEPPGPMPAHIFRATACVEDGMTEHM